jgi:hypothetical protein
MDERASKELAVHVKATEKFQEKKQGKQQKLQHLCLEQQLKHSLFRQKVLMETLERGRCGGLFMWLAKAWAFC